MIKSSLDAVASALIVAAFVVVVDGAGGAFAFSIPHPHPRRPDRPSRPPSSSVGTGERRRNPSCSPASSRPYRIQPLSAIIDVPDGFFTLSGFAVGLALSVSKVVTRVKIEERAWEQRLEEGRERRLAEDLTLTELDLRKEEASGSYSAMGSDAVERRGRRRREEAGDGETRAGAKYSMSDDEIDAFEREHGIEYDPYYDEPYEIDELPTDVNFREDKQYGDRMYENGEVFYKDGESGLYYRQGSKPRLKKFWNF